MSTPVDPEYPVSNPAIVRGHYFHQAYQSDEKQQLSLDQLQSID